MSPTAFVPTPINHVIRSVDRQLLMVMRGGESFAIGELIEALGVTATAVRQRIERLLGMGLVERKKIVAGRGRPTYNYRLTVSGHQSVGVNPAELADAMWREILAIEDTAVRGKLLSAVASRLGRQFAVELSADGGTNSLALRIEKLSQMMVARQMATEVSHDGGLPVLEIGACPYPSLTDTSDDRTMCKLEEQMISEALGTPVHLSNCRLDGDSCCKFSATTSSSTVTATSFAKTPRL
jgi:predicted ArsR family transcriptional regulator